MKIIITFIVSILSLQNMSAQTLQIQYEFVNTYPDQPVLATKETHQLISNSTISTFIKLDDKLLYYDEKSIEAKSKNGIVTRKISDNHYTDDLESKFRLFKDYSTNNLESNALAPNKELFIKEELGTMEWEISEKDTTHLNFSCKIATTNFKGRDWTVFFTDSLGFNAAPWKFNGLPGVILYAISSDEVYSYSAVSVKTSNENTSIENPFTKKEQKEMLTWEEYKKEYYNILKRMINKLNSMNEEGEPNSGKATLNNPIEDVGFTVVE